MLLSAALAALAALTVVDLTLADDSLTQSERQELERLQRQPRQRRQEPSIVTTSGNIVLAVQDGRKVGYQVGSNPRDIIYFNDLPEELRDYTSDRVAAVQQALSVGFQIGREATAAKGIVDETLGTVVDRVTDVVARLERDSKDVEALKTNLQDLTSKPPPTDKNTKSCSSDNEGQLRFNLELRAAEACIDNKWAPVVSNQKKDPVVGDKERPGNSCVSICAVRGPKSGDYFSTVHGQHPDGVEVFCDCVTEGGGWTLFATKEKWNFKNIIARGVNSYNAKCLRSRTSDCAGIIPASAVSDFSQILMRFNTVENSDTGTGNGMAQTVVVWKRNTDTGTNSHYNSDWEQLFTRGNRGKNQNPKVCGFYRKQSWRGNKRDPEGTLACVNRMYFYANNGISEAHSDSDDWIDMWSGRDGGDSYDKGDGGNAHGTKCLASYCSLNDPILFMYR